MPEVGGGEREREKRLAAKVFITKKVFLGEKMDLQVSENALV